VEKDRVGIDARVGQYPVQAMHASTDSRDVQRMKIPRRSPLQDEETEALASQDLGLISGWTRDFGLFVGYAIPTGATVARHHPTRVNPISVDEKINETSGMPGHVCLCIP
jgi:hypothetical protein